MFHNIFKCSGPAPFSEGKPEVKLIQANDISFVTRENTRIRPEEFKNLKSLPLDIFTPPFVKTKFAIEVPTNEAAEKKRFAIISEVGDFFKFFAGR